MFEWLNWLILKIVIYFVLESAIFCQSKRSRSMFNLYELYFFNELKFSQLSVLLFEKLSVKIKLWNN
jgi:hypothetical protein